jgi:protocatechuate 3,4-dioxygenase beta subunit
MKTAKQIACALSLGLTVGIWFAGCATKQPAATPAAGAGAKTETDVANPLRLTGSVVDTNGQPIAGATLEFYQRGAASNDDMELNRQAVSGTNGAFEVRVARSETILLARKPGLAPAWMQWHTVRLRKMEPRLVLTQPSFLAGLVLDERDQPVADAEVFVVTAFMETQLARGGSSYEYLSGKLPRSCFSARTGADGSFRIEGFPANASADLGVIKPGRVVRPLEREYMSPETMQCRAGDTDIKLIVEPAGSIEGKVVAQDSGQPLAGAIISLQPTRHTGFRPQVGGPTRTGADGTFRITDVAAGACSLRASFGTNALPDWVAETVPVSVESGQITRDVTVTATRGGILEIAVVSKEDRQPLGQINVGAYRQSSGSSGITASNGIALLRLAAGDYQVSAYRENSRSESIAATVEESKTNRVEVELAAPLTIKGVVRRPDGQLASGLPVRIVGGYGIEGDIETDSGGRFEMAWDPQRFGGGGDRTPCLFISDTVNNLAAAQDIDEDTGALDLRLEPGLTIVGSAVSPDGQKLTNATGTLVFWTGNSGMHLNDLARTNVSGRFEITGLPPGRRYGLYVSAPGYGQKYVSAVESEAGRTEIEPVELKPAILKLAGQVLDQDDKPVAGVYVNMSGDDQPNGNTRTDREGQFTFNRVCEGRVRLFAHAQNTYGNITAEGGDTNVVLRLGQSSGSSASSRKLKGTIAGPDGKPAAGTQVAVFPAEQRRWVKTDTNGAFNLAWTVQPWQSGATFLIVRDTARNLAAAKEIGEDVTEESLKLKPGAVITGRVQDPGGVPLARATMEVMLLAGRSWEPWSDKTISADADGKFEITCLPAGPRYDLYASAPGYGRARRQLNVEEATDTDAPRIDLGALTLKPADHELAGQVVNDDDKPVSSARVQIAGNDQPQTSSQTDRQGRFRLKVCEGQVRLFVSKDDDYANVTLEAGDTNAVITLSRRSSSFRAEEPRRRSLQGLPLPDLTPVGLDTNALPAGQPGLLCLFDAEQRPSRHFLRQLAGRHDTLKQRGLAVAALQVAVITDDAWAALGDSVTAPFPIGRVKEKSAKTRWATDSGSLPWLILVNPEGRVAAEGFRLEELDSKLKDLAK